MCQPSRGRRRQWVMSNSGSSRRTYRLAHREVVAMAVAAGLAVAVAGCAAHGVSAADGARPSRQPVSHSDKAPYQLPALGAAGFPRRTYPQPRHGGAGSISACPAPSGVARLDVTQRARAAVYWASAETRSFDDDLHHTDRAWWSAVQTNWRDRRSWSNSHAPKGPGAPHVPGRHDHVLLYDEYP
jgi:hypothetical protein